MLRMKHFYGYGRRLEDAPEDCDETWLDADGSDRVQRADMIKALRRDAADVVVVLARGDLGQGAEIPAIEKAIAAMGATVEVREPEKPAPQKPGPRSAFQPTPERDEKYRKLYRSWLAKKAVLAAIRRDEGWDVSWGQIRRRYGLRGHQDEPLEAAE